MLYWVLPFLHYTGRYEHLSVDERKCPFCNNAEDEGHVLFNCHLYEDIILELIEKATILEPNFTNLSDLEKLKLGFYQIYFDKVYCQNLLYNFKKKNVFICR